jgi:hypothetical protein
MTSGQNDSLEELRSMIVLCNNNYLLSVFEKLVNDLDELSNASSVIAKMERDSLRKANEKLRARIDELTKEPTP